MVSAGQHPPQGKRSRTEHCLTASALLPAAELLHSPKLDFLSEHLHADCALDVVMPHKSMTRTQTVKLSLLSVHRHRQNDALPQNVRFAVAQSIHAGAIKKRDPVGTQ